jgi:hypothetical protein
LKPKKERVRKYSREFEAKRKWGKPDTLCFGEEGERILLEGTQAVPARPSDKDRIRVKTLGW